MKELKLQHLILKQTDLLQQGISIDYSINTKINEVSNLFLAFSFIGNTETDNLLISNRINSILNTTEINKPFILNLFN